MTNVYPSILPSITKKVVQLSNSVTGGLGGGGTPPAITQSYASNNAAVLDLGLIGAANPTYQQVNSADACKVFVVNGTECTAKLRANTTGAVWEVSIDGGAYSNITMLAANTDETKTLFTGLTDTDHCVVIRRKGIASNFFIVADCFTVTGTLATIRAAGASDGVGYGPHVLTSAAAWSTSALTGSWDLVGGQYIYSLWPDCTARIRGRGTSFKVWLGEIGGKFAVWVDGVKQATVTAPNTGRFNLLTLASGLSDAEHIIDLVSASDSTQYVVGVMFTGGTAPALGATPPSALPGIAAFGDSIARGTAGTGLDSSLGVLAKLAFATGKLPYNRGVNGNKIAELKARTANITGLNASISDCLIIAGTNDLNAGTTIGDASTSGTYTGDWKLTLDALISGLTNAQPIRVLKILPRTGFTPNQLATYDDALVVAAAACSDPGRVTVTNVGASDPWILQNNGASVAFTDVAGDTSDGLHPDDSGCTKIAIDRLEPLY